jgi:hypothetical protein
MLKIIELVLSAASAVISAVKAVIKFITYFRKSTKATA